mmetsp:Transcript_9475/g.22418  ORF Transcript_9475/g.22418 Transcript_9475/m.22418 type:complete len:201 (-) Transcript_9475:1516-2118(-)
MGGWSCCRRSTTCSLARERPTCAAASSAGSPSSATLRTSRRGSRRTRGTNRLKTGTQSTRGCCLVQKTGTRSTRTCYHGWRSGTKRTRTCYRAWRHGTKSTRMRYHGPRPGTKSTRTRYRGLRRGTKHTRISSTSVSPTGKLNTVCTRWTWPRTCAAPSSGSSCRLWRRTAQPCPRRTHQLPSICITGSTLSQTSTSRPG